MFFFSLYGSLHIDGYGIGANYSAYVFHSYCNIFVVISGSVRDRVHVPRILVCAPSNAAVDELALKLKDLKESLPDSKQFTFVRSSNHSNVEKTLTKNTR